jgi:hypothetical protein
METCIEKYKRANKIQAVGMLSLRGVKGLQDRST